MGPLSARVRGLFIKHTRTGNPLVDSVAEHQATPPTVYVQYYHFLSLLGPAGFMCGVVRLVARATARPAASDAMATRRSRALRASPPSRTDALLFVLTYSLIAAYFSLKMIRLVLILSPGACCCGAIGLASAIEVAVDAWRVLEAQEAAAGRSSRAAASPARAAAPGGVAAAAARGGGRAADEARPR